MDWSRLIYIQACCNSALFIFHSSWLSIHFQCLSISFLLEIRPIWPYERTNRHVAYLTMHACIGLLFQKYLNVVPLKKEAGTRPHARNAKKRNAQECFLRPCPRKWRHCLHCLSIWSIMNSQWRLSQKFFHESMRSCVEGPLIGPSPNNRGIQPEKTNDMQW